MPAKQAATWGRTLPDGPCSNGWAEKDEEWGTTMFRRRIASLCVIAVAGALGALATPSIAVETKCDDTFVGAEETPAQKESWAGKANWLTKEIPLPSQFACIPESWGLPTYINLSDLPVPLEVKGLNDQSSAPLRLDRNALVLTDPTRASVIKNLKLDGLGALVVNSGDEVTLGGGRLGGESPNFLAPAAQKCRPVRA